MTIDFRKKVALIMACYVLLISLHLPMFKAYADSEKLPTNEVFYALQKEFEYDSNTDTYYFPITDIDKLENQNSKSATIAVSGAVISSVLTLAVKAGLDFATTDSMSEFVSRFFMLDGIKGIADSMNKVVKDSVGGVLNFSRSLLDSIGSKFAELMAQNKVSSVYIRGRRIPFIYNASSSLSTSEMRYLFESSTLPKVSFDCSEITESLSHYDSDIYLPLNSIDGTFSISARKYRTSSPRTDDVYMRLKQSDGSYATLGSVATASLIEFPYDTFAFGMQGYAIPYIQETGGKYRLGIICAIYSTITGYLSEIDYKLNSLVDVPKAHVVTGSTLPSVIGSAWNGGSIPTVDNGDLPLQVPKDTNTLVGKTPTDIDSPTYEIWTPGTTVVPPSVNTGTDSPPVDDILPPITEDTPGDDTNTDNPGDSTPGDDTTNDNPTSWNWLKELLNRLLELIQTIIDWLTSFWDRLLEFIKSLFVPGDNFFTDLFSELLALVQEKIPDIDIGRLEELAVGEKQFEDVYVTLFGVKCLIVKGTVINQGVTYIKPIIQGVIALFLLLFNYNQIYFLIRGTSLTGASNTVDNMKNDRKGGRR